jgi:tRNA nucleotidyltransferase/poly(A) polymerase
MEEFKKMLIEPTAKEITDALRSVDALSNSSV